MAEAIAFDIATELIIKLSSLALSQIGLWWNLKDDLDDLKRTVSTIKAVLLDAEEKSATNNLVKVWLEELKDVLYDADDLIDDFSTETLWKDLMGENKLTKEGKKLRTLLHFPKARYYLSDETWDPMIVNCRCLRVLEMNFLYFTTIPRSIYKLKHLRYLDFSKNRGLRSLPESICKIQNLQALKLDWCDGLEELPNKIERLVNLTHLACHGCCRLTHTPRGIGKLMSLETLSMFVVDKDRSHGGADLSELSGLNNLRGELEITNLGFVKNAKEKFKAANLKEKQHLRSLVLQWGSFLAWGDDNHDEERSLEDLQPHPNLKELGVRGWRGDAKFPNWFSLLTNLVHIAISGNFKQLPSFAQLPYLKQLKISYCTELEYMDDNSPKGSQGKPESFFPSLKHLWLWNCSNMKSWWRTTEAIGYDTNEDDTTVMGTSTVSFPCLSSLKVRNCPLTSMPLYPSLDDELELVNTSTRPLKQTTKMNMNAKTPSSSTSSISLSKLKSFRVDNIEGLDTHMLDECLQHLTGLKSLTIEDCKEVDLEGMQWEALKNLSFLRIRSIPLLESLPLGLQHLTNLQELSLFYLPNLASLPDEMRCLTNLKYLNMKETPQLKERCREDIGADWHKIAHIPNIQL
ncbi:putative disease resistance protein RGA1 isoform X2 [Gossypium hirsutum]|uniref:Disease resistance protein RGA1 isoform X2 n=1 Tax=Gossypium hirsutum TaxID=3635 RepID=A0A1U8MEA1_GOSHI|nr:putative disease resistance protein RGA1 isoform X2 [Gossypium hirsutum]